MVQSSGTSQNFSLVLSKVIVVLFVLVHKHKHTHTTLLDCKNF